NINKDEIIVRGSWVHNMPKGLPDTSGLRILRQGLLLGEMKKQRFEPSQALANTLHIEDYDKTISFFVDDHRTIRYLKGETIELDGDYEDGWYLIAVEGFPLGWAKVANNNLKNKYFPGWRWM
ncbi:MAG TPA: SAM-dependent methyltransferase, partial [Clostridiales bacterium]|nr:SAM-dependent methyltransferase [Clostridiales bacterium]